jgi:hypothetical protein
VVIGGNYVLSWTGTATATVAGAAVTSGVPFSLAANTNAEVKFSGGTFSLPKLERGVTATPFDFRAPQQELVLCQRYYETSYDIGTALGTVTNNGAARTYITNLNTSAHNTCIPVTFKVTKRAVPVVTLYSPANGSVGNVSDAATASSPPATPSPIGMSGMSVTCSLVSATVINVLSHWTAEAEL